MTAQLLLQQVSKVDDLEIHVDNLLQQKDLLQNIEEYTSNRLDFGDLLETYQLLVKEIERLQQQLREERQRCLLVSEERGCFEEEEEEIESSFSSKYNIEHVIRDEDGKLRPVKPEDLSIEKHKGVRDAFRLLYQFQRQKQYEEEEEEGLFLFNKFDVEGQRIFLELLKRRVEEERLKWGRKR